MKHCEMELKVMRVISFQYPVPLTWDGRDVERAIIRAPMKLDNSQLVTLKLESGNFIRFQPDTGAPV